MPSLNFDNPLLNVAIVEQKSLALHVRYVGDAYC